MKYNLKSIQPLSLLLAGLIALVLAAHAVHTAKSIVNVPIWDDYDVVLNYVQIVLHGEEELSLIRKLNSLRWQNNEHRVLFVHLLPIGVYLGAGSIDFQAHLFAFNLVFVLLLVPLFLRPTRHGLAALLVFVAFALHPANYEVFLWVTGAYQHGVGALLALWTFYLLTRRAHPLLLSATGVLALFSTATGLLVLPIAGLVLWLEQRKRDLLVVTLIYGLALLIFFVDYQGTDRDRDLTAMLLSVPGLVLSLGKLFAGVPAGIAIALGACFLGIAGYCFWQRLDRVSPLWFAASLYFLAVVALAAVVRGSGDSAGIASRYAFYTFLAVGSICIGLLQISGSVRLAVVAFALAVCAGQYASHPAGVQQVRSELVRGVRMFYCTGDSSALNHWDPARAGRSLGFFSERGAYRFPIEEWEQCSAETNSQPMLEE